MLREVVVVLRPKGSVVVSVLSNKIPDCCLTPVFEGDDVETVLVG